MNDFSRNVRTANAKQKIGLQSENTKSSPWFSFLNGGEASLPQTCPAGAAEQQRWSLRPQGHGAVSGVTN